MSKKLFIIASIMIFSLVSTASDYENPLLFGSEDNDAIKLVIGEVSIFSINSPERVSIRNPDIADISKVTDEEVVVIATLGGDTVLTSWDKEGKKTYNISVFPRDLDVVKEKLKELINHNLRIPSVYFRKNEVTGKIMVLGAVTIFLS